MEIEIQKLMKLKVTEQNLAALLQKIDTEINQTDVQWMHLKSLIPPREDNADLSRSKPTVEPSRVVKKEHHIDDQSVNETKLDLSLGIANIVDGNFSEEDSY